MLGFTPNSGCPIFKSHFLTLGRTSLSHLISGNSPPKKKLHVPPTNPQPPSPPFQDLHPLLIQVAAQPAVPRRPTHHHGTPIGDVLRVLRRGTGFFHGDWTHEKWEWGSNHSKWRFHVNLNSYSMIYPDLSSFLIYLLIVEWLRLLFFYSTEGKRTFSGVVYVCDEVKQQQWEYRANRFIGDIVG